MIRSFRPPTSVVLGTILFALPGCGSPGGCAPRESTQADGSSESQAIGRDHYENPFTRATFEGPGETCLTVALETHSGRLSEVRLRNRCDYAVAVLTSPLEVRVRRTGNERFVYERMSWAAYAIVYVIAAELGEGAFHGNGVVRDGGLRVRRAPEYTSIRPNAETTVPVKCEIDLAPGRYVYSLSTFEAPLGDAAPRNGSFDCAESVEKWNSGMGDAAHVSLSRDAGQVQGGSAIVEVQAPSP